MVEIHILRVREKELNYMKQELIQNTSYYHLITTEYSNSTMTGKIYISEDISFTQLYDLITKVSILVNRFSFPVMRIEKSDFFCSKIHSKIFLYRTHF